MCELQRKTDSPGIQEAAKRLHRPVGTDARAGATKLTTDSTQCRADKERGIQTAIRARRRDGSGVRPATSNRILKGEKP